MAARSFVFERVFAAAVSGGRWNGQRLRFESLRPYVNNAFFCHNAWASNRRRACLLVLAVFAVSSVSIPMPGAGYLSVPSSVTL